MKPHRLVVIENQIMTDKTPKEIRKGLNEETLFLCTEEHWHPRTNRKLKAEHYTVYHEKARPAG